MNQIWITTKTYGSIKEESELSILEGSIGSSHSIVQKVDCSCDRRFKFTYYIVECSWVQSNKFKDLNKGTPVGLYILGGKKTCNDLSFGSVERINLKIMNWNSSNRGGRNRRYSYIQKIVSIKIDKAAIQAAAVSVVTNTFIRVLILRETPWRKDDGLMKDTCIKHLHATERSNICVTHIEVTKQEHLLGCSHNWYILLDEDEIYN